MLFHSSTTFFFTWMVHLFILLTLSHHCINVNFPGQWIGRGPIAWPFHSPDLQPLDFSHWGCVKDQVYSQRVNMLDELKAWITTATANV
jgi:hypothetical protein